MEQLSVRSGSTLLFLASGSRREGLGRKVHAFISGMNTSQDVAAECSTSNRAEAGPRGDRGGFTMMKCGSLPWRQ